MTDRTEPSIGRILWYFDGNGLQEQAMPAIVSHVNDNGTVNVGCFDMTGRHFSAMEMTLLQGDDEPIFDGKAWCQWMPYQVKQHAKHKAEDERPEYQQRVVDEKNDLVTRLSALNKFLASDKYGGVDKSEQYRLSLQSSIMESYVEILSARIYEFPEG